MKVKAKYEVWDKETLTQRALRSNNPRYKMVILRRKGKGVSEKEVMIHTLNAAFMTGQLIKMVKEFTMDSEVRWLLVILSTIWSDGRKGKLKVVV